MINQTLDVKPGESYTVAVLGAKPDALSLHVFVDNNQVVPNRSKVRVYYLTPDAGNVNVAVCEGTNLTNVAYPSASDYFTKNINPCTFTFSNAQFGTNLPLTVDLKANTVTSIFAVGLFNGNPKVQLVDAQATGIPGLPNTGSVPVLADAVQAQPWLSWLLIAVVLAGISAYPVVRVLKRAS